LEAILPLETATYISDLVTSNPAASDGMNNADDHMRMIKAALKSTFPSITGAVTATHTQINNAVAATVNGVGVLADAGVFFKTNSTDGFVNTLAGDIDVKLQGVIAATFQRTAGVNFLKVKGALQVDDTITATSITAAGMCPIGSILIWPSDTLPPTTEGVFAWCNGAVVSRTTYATCFTRLGSGTIYGAGDGTTTFNLPNYQEVTLVGKSTMGGGTSPGLLGSISAGLKAVLNGLFGANQKTLVAANLPPYTPAGTNGSISVAPSGSTPFFPVTNGTIGNQPPAGGGGQNAAATNTVWSGAGAMTGAGPTFTGTPAPGQISQPFDTVQPSKTTNFIIRIA